jgi:hypothetical protein
MQANAENRRRSPRHKASKAIALIVDSDMSQIANQAFAIDLSLLGARVRTAVRLQPGQRVTVIPREGRDYAVESRVIWVQDAPTHDAEAGLAFLQPQVSASPLLSPEQ